MLRTYVNGSEDGVIVDPADNSIERLLRYEFVKL